MRALPLATAILLAGLLPAFPAAWPSGPTISARPAVFVPKSEARVKGLERDIVEERAKAVEAATVPALRETDAALRLALDGEKSRNADLRAERGSTRGAPVVE